MEEQAHILIADDDAGFLQLAAATLQQQGYVCTTVADAAAAFQALQQTRFELLIADVKMPGNLGLELIESLRHFADGMPVILMTGYPTIETAVKVPKLPVVAYMVKPFRLEDLLVEVQEGVKRARLLPLSEAQRRSEHSGRHLRDVVDCLGTQPNLMASPGVTSLLTHTLGSILDGLLDLARMAEGFLASTGPQTAPHATSQLAERSLGPLPRDVLEDAVRTLEKSKSAFKSKELGQVRKRLEELLKALKPSLHEKKGGK